MCICMCIGMNILMLSYSTVGYIFYWVAIVVLFSLLISKATAPSVVESLNFIQRIVLVTCMHTCILMALSPIPLIWSPYLFLSAR